MASVNTCTSQCLHALALVCHVHSTLVCLPMGVCHRFVAYACCNLSHPKIVHSHTGLPSVDMLSPQCLLSAVNMLAISRVQTTMQCHTGSSSHVDSLMLPVGEDESLVDVYMEHKHDEGERFDWLQRPLPSDAFHYAAAEVKTILQLYHQVRKDNKDPDQSSPEKASSCTPLPGPVTPYKSQHAERRRVLTQGLSGKQRSEPIVSKPPLVHMAAVSLPRPVTQASPKPSSSPAKKGSKKSKSWMSPCLGG